MASPERNFSNNPEQQPNPYSQIPDLVHGALFAKPKDARRAQNVLLTLVQSSEFFDPTIIAVANIQGEILNLARKARTPKNTAKIKPALQLLHQVLMQGIGAANSETNKLTLRLTQDVLSAAGKIDKNNTLFKNKRWLSSAFPEDLQNLENFIPLINNAHNNNQESLQVTITLHHAQREESPEIEQFQKWINTMGDLLDSKPDPKFERKDMLIDLLKQEPNTKLEGRERLYNRKYAGISLEDIGQMDYPLDPDDFIKINNFLIVAFSDNANNLYLDQDILNRLFFENALLYDLSGPLPIKNKKLLVNLSSWQEYLAYYILFETTIDIDLQLTTLLKKMPHTGNLAGIIYFSTNPLEMDPEREKPLDETITLHPVLAEACMQFFQNSSPEDLRKIAAMGVYIDEIGAEYLASTVIAKLEKRLSALELSDKFKQEVERLKANVKEMPYSKLHLDIIQQVFEKNCGQEFLSKLNNNSAEILEITKSVWQDAIDRMHFLPMEYGQNIIGFSPNSVPNLLGLKSINMTRVGNPQDWNISVSFAFENTIFELYAVLNKERLLELKAPLEKENPGLYAMLNHIAVLTFHDLVVQEKKERERRPRTSVATQDQEKQTGKTDGAQQEDGQPRRSERTLPRVQKDTDLIKDVYVASGREPRRVELHRRQLPRAKDYQAAIDLHQETITKNGVSQQEIQAAEQMLEEARRRVYRISEQKRLSVPAKFKLETVHDPLTGEEVYLETWVVEHTSPKPTEEELSSPLQLFRRYYKNSSALAFLDQMKPWFVGQ